MGKALVILCTQFGLLFLKIKKRERVLKLKIKNKSKILRIKYIQTSFKLYYYNSFITLFLVCFRVSPPISTVWIVIFEDF